MLTRRTLMRTGMQAGAAMALLGATGRGTAGSAAPDFTFPSIDGGTYRTGDWRGKPVLVVNTASMCGFTPQYADLQALQDHLGKTGVVLAVPSDDFNQEYGSDAEVKKFCELNYSLTLPMTTIQHVAKDQVHPFYAWVRDTHGFVPGWNFNKVLLAQDGSFVQAWGSMTGPMSDAIRGRMEALAQA
jgi:glutathione peroxidase